MPSKDSGRTPIVSRRFEIWRALNPASTSNRHWLVAINEQLPALPLPRTLKLSTRLLKRTVGPMPSILNVSEKAPAFAVEGALLAAPSGVSDASRRCQQRPSKTCALKKNLAFLTVPLEFPEANADVENSAMAID